jgi:hypothetical protein
VAGLAAAVDAARMLGDSERAARWSLQLEALRAVVRRPVGEAAARNGGAIAPVLDRAGGRDWAISGRLAGSGLQPGVASRDGDAGSCAAYIPRRPGDLREFHNLHHHLGFRVWQTSCCAASRRASRRASTRGLAWRKQGVRVDRQRLAHRSAASMAA